MMNASRRISICGAVFSLVLFASFAAAQTPVETPLGRALDRVDLAVSGIGQFTPSNSGTTTILVPEAIALVPSNTLGALVELRYTRSPLIGIQFNYSFARYTENFNVNPTTGTPPAQQPFVLGVQSKVNEYSIGYVAHGPTVFGLRLFGGGGVGGIEFKPTAGGGLGLPPQVRAGLYYHVGLEQSFLSEHFGFRVQFRQVFYGAPDFNQNYLAIGARTNTVEPGAGFYLRF
jgi:hypothetical protein